MKSGRWVRRTARRLLRRGAAQTKRWNRAARVTTTAARVTTTAARPKTSVHNYTSRVKRRRDKPRAFGRSTLRRERRRLSTAAAVMEESVRQGIAAPTDYYEKTMDWLQGQVIPARFQIVHQAQRTALRPPRGVDEPLPAAFTIQSYESPAPYIAELPYGRVWGELGTVITPDDQLAWDASVCPPFLPQKHAIFQQQELPALIYADETIAVLTYWASRSYDQWMWHVLARIDLIRRSGIEIDRYVVNDAHSAFQQETLQQLGIPQEKLIHCHQDFHLEAKRLIVPVIPASEWGPHQWQLQFLRKSLLPKSAAKRKPMYERIYISRLFAQHRKAANEEQIMNLLRPLGFTCVHLEHHTVESQAEILSSAKAIVAPHGAGLANLIFCHPGTKVIELLPADARVNNSWLASNQLDLDYYAVFEDRESAEADPSGQENRDITVDVAKLSRVLALASLN